MGGILSRFWKKPTTYQTLEKLEKEINKITQLRRQNVTAQTNTIRYILTYGIVLWLLVVSAVYYLLKNAQRLEDYYVLMLVVVFIPVILYLSRRTLSWWYKRRILKDDDKLKKLKEQKAKILEDVMDKETYKVATQILERFEPSKLASKSFIQMQSSPARPLNASINGGDRTLELRRRTGASVPESGPQKPQLGPNNQKQLLNQSHSAVPPESNAANRSILSSGPAATPASKLPGEGGPAAPSLFPPDRGGPRARPLQPRPILPRERSYFDKMVEYLIGDGPSNRYALICRQCQSHNGMALREEFEYISYRCCYCYYWNPARKQRPVAPKLPTQLLQKQPSDSSDDDSENSDDNSRRSSMVGDNEKGEKSPPDSDVDSKKMESGGETDPPVNQVTTSGDVAAPGSATDHAKASTDVSDKENTEPVGGKKDVTEKDNTTAASETDPSSKHIGQINEVLDSMN